MNRDYIERRNYLKEKLESLGFELTAQPEGAFYIFPSIKRFTENDFEFCVDVLEKALSYGSWFLLHRYWQRVYSNFICL